MVSPWYGDCVQFILIIFFNIELNEFFYFLIAFPIVAIALFLWMIAITYNFDSLNMCYISILAPNKTKVQVFWPNPPRVCRGTSAAFLPTFPFLSLSAAIKSCFLVFLPPFVPLIWIFAKIFSRYFPQGLCRICSDIPILIL